MANTIQLIQLPTHTDDRGSFVKIFQSVNKDLEEFTVHQVNYVTSAKNTLRGMHYQTGNHAEAKFFRVITGSIQLVCFCINPTNKSFTKSFSYRLNTPTQGILVPKGFATGYLTLQENTAVLYLSDNDYNLNAEKGLRWDDPLLKVSWDSQSPSVSKKDNNWPNFRVND